MLAPRCFPALAAALLSTLSFLHADDKPVDSSRFETTVLASGLIQPMELAVAPDGTVFFIELNGNRSKTILVAHRWKCHCPARGRSTKTPRTR